MQAELLHDVPLGVRLRQAVRQALTSPCLPPAELPPQFKKARPPAPPPVPPGGPEPGGQPAGVARDAPFDGAVAGGLWNAQALFAYDPGLYRQKIAHVTQLLRHRDFLLITEAHVTDGEKAAFRGPAGTTAFWSVGSSSRAGVGIILKDGFLSRFNKPRPGDWEEMVPGRAARLSLRGPEGNLDLYVLYFAAGSGSPAQSGQSTDAECPKAQRHRMREVLGQKVRDHRRVLSVLAGDFNWTAAAEDRITKSTGAFSGQDGLAEERHWRDIVLTRHRAHELFQAECTHDGPLSRGRLDRIYWNSHAAYQLDHILTCYTLPWKRKLSQHCPVVFARRESGGHRYPMKPLDASVLKHPQWATRAALSFQHRLEEAARSGDAPSPARKVLMLKTSMREVAEALSNERQAEGSGEVVETDPLGWTMRALTALRRDDPHTQRLCTRHYPLLHDLISRGPQALRDHAIAIAKEQAVAELRELAEAERERGYDVADISNKRRHLMTKLRRLAPGRAGALTAVRRQDGSITSDPAEVSSEFRRHWRQVFDRRTHNRHLLSQWIREDIRDLPASSWRIEPDHLRKAIEHAPSSSPGPDGIPLIAWRILGPLGEQVLWEALQMLTDPTQAEEVERVWRSLNESDLVFIPKLPAGEIGAADEARPINVANGDNRILANAVRYPMEEAMGRWVSHMQRGFLPGRSMLQNVLEMEHHMQLGSLRDPRAMAIFFDFQAAFPSVCHGFLLDVLEALRLPVETLTFIRNLYKNNRCSIIVGGQRWEGFDMFSGIRQGCPLSPLIFAIAMDVLLRRVARLFPDNLVRAYADDLAMLVHDPSRHLAAVGRLMMDFALCSGLSLNVRKTVVVPLWEADLSLLRQDLSRELPEWAAVQLDFKAKYLGFYLGPLRGHDSFARPLKKFADRALLWAQADGGSLLAALAYKVYILPVLLFVAQLEDLPQSWPDYEQEAVQRLFPGPWKWLPLGIAHNLKLLGFPLEIPDLEIMVSAIRLRVARDLASKGCDPRALHSELQAAIRTTTQEDRLLRWRRWYDAAHGSGMVRNAERLREQFGVTRRAVEEDILGNGVREASQRGHEEQVIMRAFQRTTLRLVIAAGPDRHNLLHGILDSQLRRWSIPLLPGRRAQLAIRRVGCLRGRVPPRCIFAVIRAWCNGWVVQRRFGNRAASCLMGCDDHDSIEHCACCPRIRGVARARLDLEMPSTPATKLEAFLLLCPGAVEDELRRRALWCGAVYRWHGVVRHQMGDLGAQARLQVLHHVLRDIIAGTHTVL